MATDIDKLAEQIGRLADAIDELVGSNIQMIDMMAQQIQRDADDSEPEQSDGPVYLDDPAPAGQQGQADA